MTDYTPDEQRAISDAGQARAELRQLDKAFEQVRQELFALFEAAPIDAADVRLHCHAGLQVLKRVRSALEATVAEGDVAEGAARMRAILAGEDRA
jgi:hypothetical protein